MKIAIFHDYIGAIGGGEKLVLTLARGLKADVITTDVDEDSVKKMGFEDVNIISLGGTVKMPPLKQSIYKFKNKFRFMETALSLPAMTKKEIEALIRVGYYSSKSEAVKDAFRALLDTKPALKLASAIELYKSREVSLSKAAEIAGMNIEDFKRVLSDREVKREIKPDTDIDKKVEEIMEWRG